MFDKELFLKLCDKYGADIRESDEGGVILKSDGAERKLTWQMAQKIITPKQGYMLLLPDDVDMYPTDPMMDFAA